MNYDFSFSKKALSFVLAGSTFVGIMLFIAGLLIGTNWKAEPVIAANVVDKQTVDTPPPPPPAPEQPAVAPQEPVLSQQQARPEAVAPDEADASSSASLPVRQAHGSAVSLNSRRWQPSTVSAAPHDDELKVVQEAEPAVNEDDEKSSFSVQVGAFVLESEAHQLVRQLQKKGYTPIVLAANDDDSRLWYSVRIGAFTNKTEAAQAASNIAGQEKIKAVVRPLGSL